MLTLSIISYETAITITPFQLYLLPLLFIKTATLHQGPDSEKFQRIS